MLKEFVTLIFLLSFTVLTAFATPQIPDLVIYGGKEYPIWNEDLLYDYFKRFPDRNPKSESPDDRCSALWRGYRATFEISHNTLYLKDITVHVCFGTPSSELEKVVPSREKLAIEWYTGLLYGGYGGNDLDPYSIESMDAFEKYSFFEIEDGKFKEVRHFDNKQYRAFKKNQFVAFKKTKEYMKNVSQMLADDKRFTKKDADANIQQWIFSYTNTFLVK